MNRCAVVFVKAEKLNCRIEETAHTVTSCQSGEFRRNRIADRALEVTMHEFSRLRHETPTANRSLRWTASLVYGQANLHSR